MTVYENGKSKLKRKRPFYTRSTSMNNNANATNERLLQVFDLIENEDVDSLKSLLATWKISSRLSSIKFTESSNTVDDNETANNNIIPDKACENIVQCKASNNDDVSSLGDEDRDLTNNNSLYLEENTSPSVKTNHECHPLCSCKDELNLATSPSTSENTNFDSTSISVILHNRDELGRTALHLASLVGNPLTVELLISHNDVSTSGLYRPTNCINCKDVFGMTPIHYASMKGHQNILLLLLHADADHNAIDNEKNTPLHVAANHGQESCIKALIYYAEHQSCPLDLNAQNSSEDTPMHLAAKWGFSKIVDILLSYDAR